MPKHLGYDVGGGELPASPDLVVVDKIDQATFAQSMKFNGLHWKKDWPHFIHLDVTAPLWGEKLVPKPYALCSRLIRYLPGVNDRITAYDPEVIRRFAGELTKIVSPPGVLVVLDYAPLVWEVVREVQSYAAVSNWWFVAGTERINQSDEIFPDEVRTVFVRNPNPFGV